METNLLTWIKDATYKPLQDLVRASQTEDEKKQHKGKLPAITPSMFKEKHTGLICIDFDGHQNTSVKNWGTLKEDVFSKLSCIAYAGYSVSGNGYWIIIPITFPDKHLSHYLELERRFKQIGLTTDNSKKNPTDLRFYSFDQDAYINHNAERFEDLYLPPKPKIKPYKADSDEIVHKYVKAITERKIDITGGYDEWLKIAFSFADQFGESGREMFHAVSQMSILYNYEDADRKFSEVLKSSKKKHTAGTFIKICHNHGLTLSR